MAKTKGKLDKPLPDGAAPLEQGEPKPQPSYFLSLTLENVRCFGPKQVLDLSDGDGKPARWTVIFGVNGTGKTTLLQLLVGFEELPRPSQFPKGFRLIRFLDLHLRDDRRSFMREEPLTALCRVKVATSHSLAIPPAQIVEYGFTMYSNGRWSYGFPDHDPSDPLASPRCYAYGAGRRVGVASLSEVESDDPTATLFSDKADLRNPEEWLLRLDYAASKPSDLQDRQKTRLSQAKQLLLNILPEIEDIRLTTPSGSHPTPRAEFKTPYGWVPLRHLGYGYQTLITWVTDFANRMVERYPDSPDPLAEPAVVLVDEIDLHLHPLWQRKLMDFLTARFPNTQFIVTAHSPLVAQAAADANLAVLRREGDHVVIDNDVDNIRGWRIDQILTSGLFGLESARPPQIEGLLAERKELLTKPVLTDADRRRLQEIETKIGDLPTGETAQEVKEMGEIRKTLDLLIKGRKPSQ